MVVPPWLTIVVGDEEDPFQAFEKNRGELLRRQARRRPVLDRPETISPLGFGVEVEIFDGRFSIFRSAVKFLRDDSDDPDGSVQPDQPDGIAVYDGAAFRVAIQLQDRPVLRLPHFPVEGGTGRGILAFGILSGTASKPDTETSCYQK